MQRNQIVGYAKGSFLDDLNNSTSLHQTAKVPGGGIQGMLNDLYREIAGKKRR
jgi:hypothetical protein